MAKIRICDWTKNRMSNDEMVFTLSIDGHTFEVSEIGRNQIIGILTDDAELIRQNPVVVTNKASATQEQLPSMPANEVQLEVGQGDVGSGEVSEGNIATAEPSPSATPELEIPKNPLHKLPVPPISLVKKVIQESTRFQEGSLPALTVGNKAQREAARKLKDIEDAKDKELSRKGGDSFNVNSNYRSQSGYQSKD